MSPLPVPGRWMSEYGASECAVVTRKNRRPEKTCANVTVRISRETEPGHPQ